MRLWWSSYDEVLALSFRKLLVLDHVEEFLSETFEGLEPNGENKPLTDANKEEYPILCNFTKLYLMSCRFIQRKIEKHLVKDRLEQLEGIKKGVKYNSFIFLCVNDCVGFFEIESLKAHFNLFSPTELALLLCGNSHISADSIKQLLKYVPALNKRA